MDSFENSEGNKEGPYSNYKEWSTFLLAFKSSELILHIPTVFSLQRDNQFQRLGTTWSCCHCNDIIFLILVFRVVQLFFATSTYLRTSSLNVYL